MNKEEILAFIQKGALGTLATVEGNKPHVRGMDTFRADENGLIFYTGKTKEVCQQIIANPEVEICYIAEGTQVRISGRMEAVEDQAIRDELIAARPFLKPLHEPSNYETLAIFRLANGKATTWSMQEMAAPKTFVDL